jgi:hypothetical protein
MLFARDWCPAVIETWSGNSRLRVGLAPMRSRTSQPEGCSAKRSIRNQSPLTECQLRVDQTRESAVATRSLAGGINGQRWSFRQSKEPRPAPPSEGLVICVCGKSAEESVSATGATPNNNSVELSADVVRLAFCFRHLPMWASFRRR